MARLRLVPPAPQRPRNHFNDGPTLRYLWPSHAEPIILGAMGLWNASADSGESSSWRVLMDALAQAKLSAFPEPTDTDGTKAWLEAHAPMLAELARCWRIEAARHDLTTLWEAIDNKAAPQLFSAQYRAYSDAAEQAAVAATAAWQRKP